MEQTISWDPCPVLVHGTISFPFPSCPSTPELAMEREVLRGSSTGAPRTRCRDGVRVHLGLGSFDGLGNGDGLGLHDGLGDLGRLGGGGDEMDQVPVCERKNDAPGHGLDDDLLRDLHDGLGLEGDQYGFDDLLWRY